MIPLRKTKHPVDIDRYIGERIRERRTMLGFSQQQTALAQVARVLASDGQ